MECPHRLRGAAVGDSLRADVRVQRQRFAEAANERGVDMPTLALAWLLSDRRVASVVVGPRRPEHLDPAVTALDLALSEPERDELASFFP